jgi:cytochrome c556
MQPRAAIPFLTALLALGLWSLTVASAGDEEEAQKAVLKLVDAMENKKGNAKAQAQAIHKKFDQLEEVMRVYKSRKKGGLGFGKDGDDIEKTIGKVGNPRTKDMTAKNRLDMRRDLAKAAELSRAMAEIAELYANDFNNVNTGKKDPAKWKQFTAKMRKGADDLSKAAKGEDAAKIQRAAADLSASCTECHGEFR